MNMLPFIMIFFLLFSYTANQMTKKFHLTQITHTALSSYLTLQRTAIEKDEQSQFATLETPETNKKEPKKKCGVRQAC